MVQPINFIFFIYGLPGTELLLIDALNPHHKGEKPVAGKLIKFWQFDGRF